jgi:hypothetical protein
MTPCYTYVLQLPTWLLISNHVVEQLLQLLCTKSIYLCNNFVILVFLSQLRIFIRLLSI